MERSRDLHDAYVEWLADLSRDIVPEGDVSAFFAGDGASIIGTDAGEWWMGAAARQAWAALGRSFREAGMRIAPDNPEAYAAGSVGWVVDRPMFRDRTGTEVRTRMTCIFRRQDGAWEITHVHNSLPASASHASPAATQPSASAPDTSER